MTFVCAQAFDMNFRLWQANREAAKKEALASEKDDIEPTQAWQKKKSAEEKAKIDAALAGKPVPEVGRGRMALEQVPCSSRPLSRTLSNN
eukprot:m.304661 g.304661  ORF g.304661 m.304661 type:complete len:90 (+) comp20175_c0_seq2:750-1019(+)